jgi:hypothetical protein
MTNQQPMGLALTWFGGLGFHAVDETCLTIVIDFYFKIRNEIVGIWWLFLCWLLPEQQSIIAIIRLVNSRNNVVKWMTCDLKYPTLIKSYKYLVCGLVREAPFRTQPMFEMMNSIARGVTLTTCVGKQYKRREKSMISNRIPWKVKWSPAAVAEGRTGTALCLRINPISIAQRLLQLSGNLKLWFIFLHLLFVI